MVYLLHERRYDKLGVKSQNVGMVGIWGIKQGKFFNKYI